jgi:hypothetical protein
MKQKKIVIKTFEQYGSDWPPSNASGFMAWFHSKISEVPDESRDNLNIDIDSISNNDYGYVTIELFYTRMESDNEEYDREREVLLREARIRAQELSDLARLQAKYGHLSAKS